MIKLGIAVCFLLNSAVLLNGEPKIVGGTPALNGQIPYQVSIQQKSSKFHFCGGSLIDLRHVVTAAHCVKDKKPSELIVWAGGNRYNFGGQIQHVYSIRIHPNYDRYVDFDSDIAILELTYEFIETVYLKSIPLANLETPDNATCIVSGWGTTSSGGSVSRNLLYAEVNVVNHTYCNQSYLNTLTSNMICASSYGKDACQGDTGGPLACNNKLIGIVSFGRGCALPGYPGVYTNVFKFVKWIEQNSLASLNNSVQNIQIGIRGVHVDIEQIDIKIKT